MARGGRPFAENNRLHDPVDRVDSQVKRIQAELLAPAARLKRHFYRHLGTERTDPEIHLAALAVDRLIQAENVRLVIKARNAGSRRTLERACERVIGIGASEESLPGCPIPSR